MQEARVQVQVTAFPEALAAVEAGTWPVLFRRGLASRVAEGLFYGLAVPTIALGFGMIAGPLSAGCVMLLGGGPKASPVFVAAGVVVGVANGLGVTIALGIAGWRRWRSGAGALAVHEDRLEHDRGGRVETLRFDDVQRVVLHSMELTLRAAGRPDKVLRHGQWAHEALLPALERALLPRLAARHRAALREPTAHLEFREPRGWGLLLVVVSIVVMSLAAVLALSVPLGDTKLGGLGVALFWGACGYAMLLQGRSLRGSGLALTATGLVSLRCDRPDIPWGRARVAVHADWLEVTSLDGAPSLSLSHAAEDSLVLRTLLPELVAAGGPSSGAVPAGEPAEEPGRARGVGHAPEAHGRALPPVGRLDRDVERPEVERAALAGAGDHDVDPVGEGEDERPAGLDDEHPAVIAGGVGGADPRPEPVGEGRRGDDEEDARRGAEAVARGDGHEQGAGREQQREEPDPPGGAVDRSVDPHQPLAGLEEGLDPPGGAHGGAPHRVTSRPGPGSSRGAARPRTARP